MASAAQQTFMTAVSAAESTRQQSKAAAFLTYGFVAANLAAYKIALADADVAYITAVNAASNTSDLQLGNIALNGPIASSNWAPLLSIA
jgi:hypothetical protein